MKPETILIILRSLIIVGVVWMVGTLQTIQIDVATLILRVERLETNLQGTNHETTSIVKRRKP